MSIKKGKNIESFNSQPHTRLTLGRRRGRPATKIFQFTASYEADLVSELYVPFGTSFNSQPHTRLTLTGSSVLMMEWSFNSQPHTRLTTLAHIQSALLLIFQFTASYEANPAPPRSRNALQSFNSQPHTRLTVQWKSRKKFKVLSIHSLIRG